MAIFGIAIRKGGQPVQIHEAEAMGASLASTCDELKSCRVLPQVGLGVVSKASTASCWASETVAAACDVDLYNFKELRNRISAGDGSSTAAELVANLYLSYGPSFVGQLRGAFSVAIWDEKRRTLLLAVDRFGVKRLCYAATPFGIVFATDPRAIFASGRVGKKVDLTAITEFLVYNVVPSPKTAFEGVYKAEPGKYIVFSDGQVRSSQYWEMRYPEDASGSSRLLAQELYELMKKSVSITSADLDPSKTGCFLSGGTDSSSVVGLLTEEKGAPANAFSIGFTEERFNELEYARIASKRFGARHVECLLGPEQTRNIIDTLVEGYDEPFGNSSAIPTYLCAKVARERGIEVLLAGDGGDELFGGNERYRTQEIFEAYHRVPRYLREWVIEPIVAGNPFGFGIFGKLQRYIRNANTGNPERYCQWRLLRVFPPEQVLAPGMPSGNGHSDLLATIRKHYNQAPAVSELNRLLYVDVKMTLGDDDLPKVTRTAELAGIRVRFPYLDHELAEFSGRLPADLKVHRLEKRYLFKKATDHLLPKAILKKKKHGFGLPIGLWLKSSSLLNGWAREILADPRTYQRGYFRREFIDRLFAEMQQDDTTYFGDLLWPFLMLELWHRRHVEESAC